MQSAFEAILQEKLNSGMSEIFGQVAEQNKKAANSVILENEFNQILGEHNA